MRYYVAAFRRLLSMGFSGGAISFIGKIFKLYRSHGLNGFRQVFSAQVIDVALPARPPNRPDDLADLSLEIPFAYEFCAHKHVRVCAVVHVFYPEMAAEIRRRLEYVPDGIDVYISTTSVEKKYEILKAFEGFKAGALEVRIFPNRGRDIAPKLVGFSDVYARYDYALSLHTKKSPHGGGHLAPWRDYLYDHLVGSAKAIQSIFDVLASDRVGFVFPQHYFPLRRYMAWGDNFSLAQKLLERQGVDLTREMELECPSGSMFWCRTDALRGLLDMKLQFEDFPEENGQVDGTMAHAIERSFLYSAEARGYSWAKVTLPDRYPLRDTVLRISDQRSIAAALKRVWRPLLKSDDSAKVQSFRFD